MLTWDNNENEGCETARESKQTDPKAGPQAVGEFTLTHLLKFPTTATKEDASVEVPLKHTKHGLACGDVRVITSSPVPEQGGWNPIPHDAARDRRLDRRARGLLFEILSYPPGWHINADKLAEMGDEGRDAIRKAMRQLEDAGYVIHLRYRSDKKQWLTASFAGNTPEVAKHLAETWAAEHAGSSVLQKASSHRGTDYQASVDQASASQASAHQSSENQALRTKRPTGKTDLKKAGKIDSSSLAAASQRACLAGDDADAPPRSDDQAAVDEASIKADLARYITLSNNLDDDTIDSTLGEWQDARPKMYPWALKQARKQSGLQDPAVDSPEWKRLRRLTFKWALRCSAEDGAWHESLLESLQ